MELKLRGMGTRQVTLDLIEKYPQKVVIKLDEVLKERGLSQGDLHRLSGVRVASINDMVNAKKQSINVLHLVAIMCALRITDIRELFDIEFDEEVKQAWEEEMKDYEGRGLTIKQKEELAENVKRMYLY
ncbi:helix-turn-helix transcriptional regulator [Bacillus haynesii]|uniref:helix-turn-helix domain-containing protein n=1 Tax=Bacillus haynesii TaxID=1925021 RepID=UPI002281B933|nr:helix-turn-helix transcriptional regulator [Bacillus haynesii]MCY8048484.1 helix-turn-helix transcriptional regulator [Bacillus haynesii]MCY8668822.1 helix-turn-helix transcriptional regulator [Bacillus haynesii]MCY9324039.1 helix-turn-helix transcriptional regulator [Bacillus haynesii]